MLYVSKVIHPLWSYEFCACHFAVILNISGENGSVTLLTAHIYERIGKEALYDKIKKDTKTITKWNVHDYSSTLLVS